MSYDTRLKILIRKGVPVSAHEAPTHKTWCGLDLNHTGECSPESPDQQHEMIEETLGLGHKEKTSPIGQDEKVEIVRDDVREIFRDGERVRNLATRQMYLDRTEALLQARQVLGPAVDIFDLLRTANYILTGNVDS